MVGAYHHDWQTKEINGLGIQPVVQACADHPVWRRLHQHDKVGWRRAGKGGAGRHLERTTKPATMRLEAGRVVSYLC